MDRDWSKFRLVWYKSWKSGSLIGDNGKGRVLAESIEFLSIEPFELISMSKNQLKRLLKESVRKAGLKYVTQQIEGQ